MNLKVVLNGFLLVILSLAFQNCTSTHNSQSIKKIGLQTELTVKIGDVFGYDYNSHPSVGNTGEYSIADETIIVYDNKTEIYDNPKGMKSGMSGADGSSATFLFKGIKGGTTTITFKELFRGDLTKEHVVKVTVTE